MSEADMEDAGKLEKIMAEFDKIEDKLDESEMLGWELTVDTGHDFDEIFVCKNRKKFLTYMNRYGAEFSGLEDWISQLK